MIVQRLRDAAARGVVDQHLRYPLEIFRRAYVQRRGRIVLDGTSTDLLGRAAGFEVRCLAGGPAGEPV